MIGVPAPVIPGQDEDGVCPATTGDDCINALPREVMAVRDVCRIRLEGWMLVIAGPAPNVTELG